MENLKNECALSFYENLCSIKGNKNVFIVKSNIDERIYVKKELKIFNKDVYYQIKDLHHKNIVKIYDILELDDKLITIEEYIFGQTIKELVEKNNMLCEEDTINIALQICEGLNILHCQNPKIIHRDIKPSNIIITNDGTIKIIDFDSSKKYDETKSNDTILMGTANFASPEQFGFSQSDERSDIYSIGVLMLYMQTGLFDKNINLHNNLQNVINKSISFNPEDRYQNVLSLQKDLYKLSNNKNKNRQALNKSKYVIPGFRSGSVPKMILATLGYSCLILLCYSLNLEKNIIISIAEETLILLTLLASIAICTNYLDIYKFMPFMKTGNKFILIIKKIVAFIIVFSIGISFSAIISIILNPAY